VGPNRLYVTLARGCAARGTTVIRMDIAGIGESQPHLGEPENVVYSSRAQEDLARAIAFAQAHFPGREIHCAGICSGAYHGFKAAVRGLPLRSVVIINPLTFFWKEGMSLDQSGYRVTAEALRYRRVALQASAWLKMLSGQVNVVAAAGVIARRVAAIAHHSIREAMRRLRLPLEDDLAAELQRVANQNTRMLFIFASSDPGLPMLREQGGMTVQRLQRNNSLRIVTIGGADHTFTPRRAQTRLVRLLMANFASLKLG
jgi:predicted alpha/beta hydrolase